MLGWALVVSYIVASFHSIWHSSRPSIQCQSLGLVGHCFYPMLRPGNKIGVELMVHEFDKWIPIDTCFFNATIPATGSLPKLVTNRDGAFCNLTLSDSSRVRWKKNSLNSGGPLNAKFLIRAINEEGSYGPVLAHSFLSLTRIVERRSEFIPHLKYGSQPIVLRFVAEDRTYGGPLPLFRNDGARLLVSPWNQSTYLPTFYVDENGLQHGMQQEISANGTNKPLVSFNIQMSALTPLRDTVNQQVNLAVSMAESFLPGSELDEIRYFLRDERLYRFFLTQIISFVHVWLEYLAFRDEIRFYRGRTNFVGVSLSSVLTRMVCSFIIFLYLLDGGGTSWVILFSVGSGVLVDFWKVCRMIQPTLISSYPFLTFNRIQSANEQKTSHYDSIAMRYLAIILYPILICWAIYALMYESYTSYYSWLISNLANAVYTFGFIGLCPQLYVNYRLKSVAHLPWKVFLYKIFSTFVDDLFAFLIEMPWKHRIMTLRDDAVFLMFLVQAYMYRVDKSRANEYGYAYNGSEQLEGEGSSNVILHEIHEKTE